MSANEKNMAEMVDHRIFKALRELYTSAPAKLKTFDPATSFARLELLHYGQDEYGRYIEVLNLNDVPVMRLGGKNNYLSLPLEPDDLGICFFCKQDLTIFKRNQGSEPGKPDDPELMNINGAFFLPGLYPKGAYDNDVVTLEVATDKKLRIGNDQGEVMTMIDKIHTILTGIVITQGTQPNSVDLAALKTMIDALLKV